MSRGKKERHAYRHQRRRHGRGVPDAGDHGMYACEFEQDPAYTVGQGLNLQVRAKSSSGCVCSCRCAGRYARCFIVLAIAPSTSCDITAMLLPPCRCCYSQYLMSVASA